MLEIFIGDYPSFFSSQKRLLETTGIDVTPYPVSHLAFRARVHNEYLELRDGIETLCRANVENQWSGRPISKLLLQEPVQLDNRHHVDLIELIPPAHQPGYPMGLEHVGFVVGDEFEEFGRRHRDVLTGQQDQGPINQPYIITFRNGRSVKFHRYSLQEVVEKEGRTFDGFHHVDSP